MENTVVHDATHSFLLRIAADGKIHGPRIDHPDGLFDPPAHFGRLQVRCRHLLAGTMTTAGVDIPPICIVLEKIAADQERLPVHRTYVPVAGEPSARTAPLQAVLQLAQLRGMAVGGLVYREPQLVAKARDLRRAADAIVC